MVAWPRSRANTLKCELVAAGTIHLPRQGRLKHWPICIETEHVVAKYGAEIEWNRGEQDFVSGRYSRSHCWRFDGGLEIAGSSSPQVVPSPWSDPAAIDPEEAFVASLSSCHMLWFLSIAAKQSFVVNRYHDHAEGVMARNVAGQMYVSRVTLRPDVTFAGAVQPSNETIDALHHEAHVACFIANSVRTEIVCQPVF